MKTFKLAIAIAILSLAATGSYAQIASDAFSGISLGAPYRLIGGPPVTEGYYEIDNNQIQREALHTVVDSRIQFFTSYSELFTSLNISARAALKLGFLKSNGEFKSSNFSSMTSRSIRFVVYSRKELLKETYRELPLSSTGLELINLDIGNCEPHRFIQNAGGEYINSLTRGGLIVIEYTLNIEDETQSTSLAAYVGAQWGTGSASLDFNSLSKHFNSTVTGRIRMFQIGGDGTNGNINDALSDLSSMMKPSYVANILRESFNNITEENSGIIDFTTSKLLRHAQIVLLMRKTSCSTQYFPQEQEYSEFLISLEKLGQHRNRVAYLLSEVKNNGDLFTETARNELENLDSLAKFDFKHVLSVLKENLRNESNPGFNPESVPNVVRTENIKLGDYLAKPLYEIVAKLLCASKTSHPDGHNYARYANSYLIVNLIPPKYIRSISVFYGGIKTRSQEINDYESNISLQYKKYDSSVNNSDGKEIMRRAINHWASVDSTIEVRVEAVDIFGGHHNSLASMPIDATLRLCNLSVPN